MTRGPDRFAGLPHAPAGLAAVVALVLAAPVLGAGGLLVPAATPSTGTATVLRFAGVGIAAVALARLARHRDVGWRGAPGAVAGAAAIAGTLGLLTLPVSDVSLDWPPPADPEPLPPSAAAPPAVGGAPPAAAPPVLRLPQGGRLEVQADLLILELPDGSTFDLGSALGGDGTAALPPAGTMQLEVRPDGGLSLTDGTGAALTDLSPGGAGFHLGDVRIEGDTGNGLVDVTGGAVTDAGGTASGQVEVAPAPPDETGRDLAATVAGVVLAVAAYYLVFLRGHLRPRPLAASAATGNEVVEDDPPVDAGAARRSLVDTLDGLLADPDPRTAIVAAYARLLAALEGAGCGRRHHEAPHEHLRRVLQPLGVRPEPLHELADLFVLARFGGAEVTELHRDLAVDALRAAADDLGVLVPA